MLPRFLSDFMAPPFLKKGEDIRHKGLQLTRVHSHILAKKTLLAQYFLDFETQVFQILNYLK